MIVKMFTRALVTGMLFAGLLAGPIFAQSRTEKSLYDRLGGQPSISAVVDEFVARVAADKRINAFFARTDIAHLKMQLVNQICEASGGPCKYTGRSM
jgi:hemoglobin